LNNFYSLKRTTILSRPEEINDDRNEGEANANLAKPPISDKTH
jgi:hypothetical protein